MAVSRTTATSSRSRNYQDPNHYDVISGVDLSTLPDEYSEMAKSNPFLKYSYTPTLWDKIGNWLGFGTGEDSYRTDMELAARQYDSQLLSLAREEARNDPQAQVARDRQAGLNPDLVGMSQAGQASEFNEPETNPTAPNGSQELSQFAGNMMSIFTTTMSLVKDVTSLSSFMEDVRSKRIQNTRGYLDSARDFVLHTLDPSGWKSEGDIPLSDYLPKSDEWARKVSDYASSMYSNKRDRKRFISALESVTDSLPTQVSAYKLWHERETSRREYAKDRVSQYYSDSDEQMSEFLGVLVTGMENLQRHQIENSELKLDASDRQAINDKQYAETIDPYTEAQAVNEENRKTKESNKTENEINQVYRDIIHKLSQQAQQGNKWAQVGLLVISAIRMYSMPQYHSSQSRSVDSKGNETISESRSFGM